MVRVEDGYVAEPGATVVDLKSRFVLPGLIDSHVHLTSEQGPSSRLDGSPCQPPTRPSPAPATPSAPWPASPPSADLGGENNRLRPAQGHANGDVPGPRIIAAGSAISIHGGHGDVNGLREDIMHVLRSRRFNCSVALSGKRVRASSARSGFPRLLL